ncbi:MAG: hypothetical protein J6T70_06890 [Bacteroidales bacterium]|nr:hypothetical protein [Bacteroidales bacterium]
MKNKQGMYNLIRKWEHKNKLLLIIKIVFPAALISVIVGGCFIVSEKPILRYTNEEIISYMPNILKQDSSFLNQVGNLFLDTNYEGDLFYNFQNSGGRHTLWTDNKNITDSFPKIREVIVHKFPDASKTKYYIWYIKKVVFILPRHSWYNQDEQSVVFLYAKNKEYITYLYPTYRLYDKDIPQENSSWIYNLKDNWYICSPNHLVYYNQ